MIKPNLLGAVTSVMLAVFSGGSHAFVTESCPDTAAFPFSGCVVAGVPPSGTPYFEQVVNVDYKPKGDGFNLTAKAIQGSARSNFVTLTDSYEVTKTKLNFKAKERGGELTGTLTIKGNIEDLGITGKKKLFSADLDGTRGNNLAGDLHGFGTTNIVCHEAISAYCSESETFYLNLLEAITDESSNVKTAGLAVTTVPVPAAVWLFGSGLLGLIAVARRKTTRSSLAV
jgi:hypothetical protein